MRESYRNKCGETVKITEEHLKTAYRIKNELANATASGRVNWNEHKRQMEANGFFDSENSNIYRNLINDYDRELTKLNKTKEILNSDEPLVAIEAQLGRVAYSKRELQKRTAEFNKIKRELTDQSIIAKEIGETFADAFASGIFDIRAEKTLAPRVKSGQSKALVVPISDWHIGALVDVPNNKYNFEIAGRVIEELATEVFIKQQLTNAKEVHVVNLGDIVEHITMRYAQAYGVEFTLSEQIVRATTLLIKFLQYLENGLPTDVRITFAGISGNHDRMESDKNKQVYGDSVATAVYYGVENFLTLSNSRIEYINAYDKYSHRLEVNGKWIKFIHGDMDGIKNKDLLGKHCSYDGINYSLILSGHIHHNFMLEVGQNKYQVSVGSIKGADEYSDKLRALASKSQTIVTVEEDGNFKFDIINLQHIV